MTSKAPIETFKVGPWMSPNFGVTYQSWSVGLSPREDGLVEVWFSKLLLGHLDPTTASFQAARPGGLETGQRDKEMCNQ